jgi:tRNA(His) 5'-end guanylyltransferase
MSNNISIIIILITLSSCSTKPYKDNFENSINEVVTIDHNSNSDNIYLIIEQSGCTTCLYKADEFYFEYKDQKIDNLFFIFTGYASYKRLRLKYGIKGNENNIFIDSASVFYTNKVRLEYPSIVYFNSEIVRDYEIASPDNFQAYTALIDFLNSSSND